MSLYILVLFGFINLLVFPANSLPNRSNDRLYTICIEHPDYCRPTDSGKTQAAVGDESKGENHNHEQDPDVAWTPQGFLRGQLMFSRNSRKYYSFMRIPYVAQPLRFEMAEPPLPWPGIRDATQRSDLCPQIKPGYPGVVVGVEDCLYLTVNVPQNIFDQRRQGPPSPVLVFIHGGSFHYGGGDEYGARYLMDEDVILVTFNYRLGALGFLTTGDGEILGNMGLKDSVMALRWVQNNIGFFGGNPGMVTLMGEDAGAAMATFLMVSPMAGGLFSKAIIQSGSALSPWALSRNPVETSRKFGVKLGCNGNNTRELAECLRSKDVLSLVMAREELLEWNTDPISVMAPTIEVPRKLDGQIIPPGMVFLAEHPFQKLVEGRFHRVPLIVGVTKDEGLLMHAQGIAESPKLLQDLNDNWNNIAPITLQYSHLGLPTFVQNQISQKIRQFYFGNEQISAESLSKLSNMYGDRYYVHGVHTLMTMLARHVPVFPYQFSFRGNHSMNSLYKMIDIKGVTHMDDLLYAFELSTVKNIEPGPETEFSQKLVRLWTSFAYNGIPGTQPMFQQPWRPISPPEALNGMVTSLYDLDTNSKHISSPFVSRIAFWNSLRGSELRAETVRLPFLPFQ